MRRESGFSLVELIVIMAIIGILLAIGTMNFSSMSKKSSVETQVRKMHSDLMAVRAEAVFQKRERAVTVSGGTFAIYSSAKTGVGPVTTVALPNSAMTAVTVVFDTAGMANDFSTPGAICFNGGTEAVVDAITINKSMLYMGKRADGTSCQPANITIK